MRYSKNKILHWERITKRYIKFFPLESIPYEIKKKRTTSALQFAEKLRWFPIFSFHKRIFAAFYIRAFHKNIKGHSLNSDWRKVVENLKHLPSLQSRKKIKLTRKKGRYTDTYTRNFQKTKKFNTREIKARTNNSLLNTH